MAPDDRLNPNEVTVEDGVIRVLQMSAPIGLNGSGRLVFVPLDEVALDQCGGIDPLALLRELDSVQEKLVRFHRGPTSPETLYGQYREPVGGEQRKQVEQKGGKYAFAVKA